MQPVQCPRCHSVNEPGAQFCGYCGQATYYPAPGPLPAPPPRRGWPWYSWVGLGLGILFVAFIVLGIVGSLSAVNSTSGDWTVLTSGQAGTGADWPLHYRAGERDALVLLKSTADPAGTAMAVWDVGQEGAVLRKEYHEAASITSFGSGDMFNEGFESLYLAFDNGRHWAIDAELEARQVDVASVQVVQVGNFAGDAPHEVTLKGTDEQGKPFVALLTYNAGEEEQELGYDTDLPAEFSFDLGTHGAGGVRTIAGEQTDPARIVQWRWEGGVLVEDSTLPLPADARTIWWAPGTLKDGREVMVTTHTTGSKAWVAIHEYQRGGQFVLIDRIELPSDGVWVALPGKFRTGDGEVLVYNLLTGEYKVLGQP